MHNVFLCVCARMFVSLSLSLPLQSASVCQAGRSSACMSYTSFYIVLHMPHAEEKTDEARTLAEAPHNATDVEQGFTIFHTITIAKFSHHLGHHLHESLNAHFGLKGGITKHNICAQYVSMIKPLWAALQAKQFKPITKVKQPCCTSCSSCILRLLHARHLLK